MQVWPALNSLPAAILRAVSARSALSSTMAGDLPPSSRVTGVRLAAAARATWRPTAVDPVKNRWSKGRRTNALPSSASPVSTAHSSGAKAAPTSSASSCDSRGVISLGLIITRLPAASAATAGASASCSG